MKKLALILCLLAVVLSSAHSDFSVYKQDGPNLVPIQNKDVAMVAEDLRVEMHPDWSRIEADITLENQGPAARLRVALPQVVTPRPTRGSALKKTTGLWDVGLKVDGAQRAYQDVTGRYDSSTNDATFFWVAPKKFIKLPVALGGINVFPDAKLKWLAWELDFAPGQQQRVSVGYSIENGGYGGNLAGAASSLRYLLKTAGLWRGGKIGRLTMKVHLDKAFSLAHLQGGTAGMEGGYLDKRPGPDGTSEATYHRLDVEEVTPSGYQIEGQSLSWEATPFIPNDNLLVHAVSYTSLDCDSVLDDSLTYGPQQAYDGQLTTAWVPQGRAGGWISIPLCKPESLERFVYDSNFRKGERPVRGLRLFAGYGKSRDLFQANNRPRTVEIRNHRPGYGDDGLRVTLKDQFDWQTIPLPAAFEASTRHDSPATGPRLYLKIIDVYPGSRHDDTCISEIQLVHD